MSRLKAEEAKKIANENSVLMQSYLDEIYNLIDQSAKEGRFQLNYTSEPSDTNLISPIQEQLSTMGYEVKSFSLKNISLLIKW